MKDNRIRHHLQRVARQVPLFSCLGCFLLWSGTNKVDAQDTVTTEARKPGLAFELGALGTISPSYEGSNRYVLAPFPVVRFHELQLTNGLHFGGGDGTGFSFYPSLGYKGVRSSKSDLELRNLPEVGQSIELGGGIAYETRNVRGFIDLRYGAIGHQGFVGETGVDWMTRPAEGLTLSFGPRLSFASINYMQSYFGVSADAATSSGLSEHSAGSGFKSAGLAGRLRYDINENWAVESTSTWHRLVGEAGSSPITALGDRNQFSFGIGITRKFRIDF